MEDILRNSEEKKRKKEQQENRQVTNVNKFEELENNEWFSVPSSSQNKFNYSPQDFNLVNIDYNQTQKSTNIQHLFFNI